MSLINDALKRVKEAQHKAPPSAELGPQLRPVEPVVVPAHHGLGWLLPLVLVGVALLTLLLLWELSRKERPSVIVRAQPDVQAASSSEQDFAKPARSSETPQSASTSVQEAAGVPTASRSATAGSPNAGAAATDSVLNTQAASPGQETIANTNSANVQSSDPGLQAAGTNPTVVEVQPPKPPPLKLQGIVFSKRPSAVISGKTVFVGDRVREFRVVAITAETATLVGAGRTNTLSLSE